MLRGKKAVVTGGGTGIGRSVAIALAEAGAEVVVSGRREEPLLETAAAFEGSPKIRTRTCDVSDRGAVESLTAWALGELGQVDIVVNSAGMNVAQRTTAASTPEEFEQVLAVNTTGAFHVLQCFLEGMRERGDGLIVNISSIAGKRAIPLGGLAYNASKFAMTALGITAGYEERENGIRVTNVYPGEVDTPLLEKRPVKVSDEHRARMLQPEDVASVVLTIALLPPRAHVPEVVIKPTVQAWA